MNRRWFARTRVSIAAMAVMSVIGCSPKTDNHEPPSTKADNVKLTPAQQQNIHLYSVAPSKFRKTVEASGVVDFDNNQATSVLAPISGPVSRLLVSLGDHVKQGAPLARVDSPDFASAVSTYRKALATAQTARRLADLDKDLVAHDGVAKREADQAETDAISAEADREAALQALISLQIPEQTIAVIRKGRPIARV